jgi:hypothetical protein
VSYPTYPAAAAQPSRPTTVTVSSYLLWITAAISLISAVLTLSMVGRMTDAYRDLYAGTANEGVEAVIVGTSVVLVVINILFAAGLAILSIFNNRGRNGARVTTWVLGGITLCCSGFGLAGTAITNSMNLDSSGTTGGPSSAEIESRLNEVLPSWYEPFSTGLSVLSLLALLGAIILLALPQSNAFFRKPAGVSWDPSTPYPYPPAGQQPPYPSYPSDPSAPSSGGYPPSTPPSGYTPSTPPSSGGYSAPPPSSGGYTPPPPSSGGYTPPPPSSGGYAPPNPPSPPSADPWGRPADDDDRRPPSGSAS